MSVSYTFSVSDTVGSFLSELRAELTDSTELHKVISITVAEEVRQHLIDLSLDPDYHKTAIGLGAQPTRHFAKVARAVESGYSEKEAFITVPSWSGLGRAFGDVQITPKNGKKWLTIPANAFAYGRSAREFEGLTFIPLGDDLAMLAGQAQSSGELLPMYWLKKEVTIPQDRSLLPTEELLSDLVKVAAAEWLEIIISNNGGLSS